MATKSKKKTAIHTKTKYRQTVEKLVDLQVDHHHLKQKVARSKTAYRVIIAKLKQEIHTLKNMQAAATAHNG